MLDGCHGAKTDHVSVSAPGPGSTSANRRPALRAVDQSQRSPGPAGTSSDGFVTVDEDWHPGLWWRGSYLSLSICPWAAWAGAEWPIRGRCQLSLDQSEDSEGQWATGLVRGSDRSGFHQSHHSPSHPLHEQHITRSRIVREPIHHTLTSNISSIRRNYSGREGF